MEWMNRKVLVVGTGISGIGALELLVRKGANAILYDGNESLIEEDIRKKIQIDDQTKIEIVLGELPQNQEMDLIVLSPGVPTDLPWIQKFRERGIPVWGEIELAYQFEQGTILAITGTNGKTTTTAIAGKIVADYCKKSFVVGNIGIPYTKTVEGTTKDSITVGEISSFQLETIEKFKPKVSSILNITPDHLDRHHNMVNYIAAKEAITKNQTKDEVCVLNYEDSEAREFAECCPATVVFFSSKQSLEEGYYLEEEHIIKVKDGKRETLINIHEMALLGTHNMENVMAAIAMTDAIGITMESILQTVRTFQAVEHRIEFVATKNGVNYYNDSKGTNPDAAMKAVQAMNRKTIVIGGGYDKESQYDE
ncbi:MAG: UDP-N-acetylmuramoyl-L-alanine--D-glutamate ligase, partial [Eubacteriales bacterium]